MQLPRTEVKCFRFTFTYKCQAKDVHMEMLIIASLLSGGLCNNIEEFSTMTHRGRDPCILPVPPLFVADTQNSV